MLGLVTPSWRSLLSPFALGLSLCAQSQRSDYLAEIGLPSDIKPQLSVVGTRLASPGRERLNVVGTLTMAGKSIPGSVVWELPGKLRIERLGEKVITATAPPLAVTPAQEALSAAEDDLVESLLNDRQEAFLYEVRNGSMPRSVARLVYQSKEAALRETGPVFDIYETAAQPDKRARASARAKRYFFDSFSGQLGKVVYLIDRDGQKLVVETLLSNWQILEGVRLPLTIERRHNGAVIFTFVAASVVVSARSSDILAQQP